jgi:hypothetical protein
MGWIEHQVCAHHGRDRPGGPNEWDCRVAVQVGVTQCGGNPAAEVHSQVSGSSEGFLDVIPKDPQRPEIEADVKDVTVQEHGSQHTEHDDLLSKKLFIAVYAFVVVDVVDLT